MAVYAHVALQKLHILPSVFLALPEEEQAFIIASIRQKRVEDVKEEKEVMATLE